MNTLPWAAFANVCGPDLLPVVIDDNILFSARSVLPHGSVLYKCPSRIKADAAIGFANWPSHVTTRDEVEEWSADPRLGFGMRCKTLQAITIRAASALGFAAEVARIQFFLGDVPSVAAARGSNPAHGILLFRSEYGFARARAETMFAEIEAFHDHPTFVVIAGGVSGYEWPSDIGNELLEIVSSETKATNAQLAKVFQ